MEGNAEHIDSSADTDTTKRARSTIKFPYGDLNDALEIAKAIHQNAGHSCTREQLAAYMQQSPNSGAFRGKLSTATTFNIIESERGGQLNLTAIGKRSVDERQEGQARVDAFLAVPLYSELFEKFKASLLPPPAGLEREMVGLGVSAKQKNKARQAFERSAEQAGFFAHGNDRLVLPVAAPDQPPPPPQGQEKPGQGKPGGGGGNGNDNHPLIQGLFEMLPEPGRDWPSYEQKQWLQTAANIFGLLYKSDAEITVNATPREDIYN